MNARGFTLLELVVATAVLAVVTAGVVNVLYQSQQTYETQTEGIRTAEEARVAMDQLVRYFRQAGNDPFGYLEATGRKAIVVSSGQIRLNSDITGSVPSITGDPKEGTGDPDGALDSIHENVVFQHLGTTLQVDIGYGLEVLSTQIQQLNITFYDKYGNQVSSPDLALKVRIALRTTDNLGMTSDVLLRRSSYGALYSGG